MPEVAVLSVVADTLLKVVLAVFLFVMLILS